MVGPTPSNSFEHSRRWSHDKLLSRNLRATAKSSVDPRGSYLHSGISHFLSPSSVFFRPLPFPPSALFLVQPFSLPFSFFPSLAPLVRRFPSAATATARHKTWWHFSPFLRSTSRGTSWQQHPGERQACLSGSYRFTAWTWSRDARVHGSFDRRKDSANFRRCLMNVDNKRCTIGRENFATRSHI